MSESIAAMLFGLTIGIFFGRAIYAAEIEFRRKR